MSNWEHIQKLLIFDVKNRKKPLDPLISKKKPTTGEDVLISIRKDRLSNNTKKSYRFYLDSASSKNFDETVKRWVYSNDARLPSNRHRPTPILFINQILNDFAIDEQKNLDALLNFKVKEEVCGSPLHKRRNILRTSAYFVPINLDIVAVLNRYNSNERSAIISKCIKVFLELPKKEQDRIMSEAMELINEIS